MFAGLTLGAEEPWKRHTIDDSSKGADGARLKDVNGDGLPDLVVGASEYGGFRSLGGRVGVFFGRSGEAWEPVYTLDQADAQPVGPTAAGRSGFSLYSGAD